jgi:hypothetical protein
LPTSGHIRELELLSKPEAARTIVRPKHRHSGLVWDVRAGKSLDQSYVAANTV